MNTFLHQVAEIYLNRYSLQHKKDSFSRRAALLFLAIGKFKRLAKNVRIKLASSKVKQIILQWVRKWRANRAQRMKEKILEIMEERSQFKVSALLRTAQNLYCHVVHI